MSEERMNKLKDLFDSVIPSRDLGDEIDKAIADNSNSIAVDLDTGIIVRAKPPAEVLFGYIPGELKGMSVHDLVPKHVRELHKTWFAQYAHNPMNRTMGSRGMQLRGVTKDGREFPVEISLASVQLNGLHLGIATVIPMVTRGVESRE